MHPVDPKTAEKFNDNIFMVKSIMKRRGTNDDDLYQEGCIGLVESIQRLNPQRGAKLSTVAFLGINKRITRYKTTHSSAIKLPANAFRGKKHKADAIKAQKILRLDEPIEDINNCETYDFEDYLEPLEDVEKEIICLYYRDDFDCKAIGKQLNMCRDTVARRKKIALQKIRLFLEV